MGSCGRPDNIAITPWLVLPILMATLVNYCYEKVYKSGVFVVLSGIFCGKSDKNIFIYFFPFSAPYLVITPYNTQEKTHLSCKIYKTFT